MSFDEVVYLSAEDVVALVGELDIAMARNAGARIAVDDGGVKVSPARASWSPPIGTTEEPT